MDTTRLFLDAVSAGIRGKAVSWADPMDPPLWQQLLRLARQQNLLPLFYETVSPCPAFAALPDADRASIRKTALRAVARQTRQTADSLSLLQTLTGTGYHPLVMKGLALRRLYPTPDLRPSSDEDLLLPPEEFAPCCAVLAELGLRPTSPEADPETAFELGFRSEDGFLYVELHHSPFAPDSSAVSQCNAWFSTAWDHAMELTEDGVPFRALGAQDHLLYLVLHAFKHFIHSGFGIRQVCDILLWAERYSSGLDWPELFRKWELVRCHRFAAALFRLGQEQLGFEDVTGGYISALTPESCDPAPLLDDLLDAGVFGGSTRSRKHSATITLGAVNAARSGRKSSLLHTLFPARESLSGTYPWLNKYPWLLPAAWCRRLFRYAGEISRARDSAPAESLQLGKDRLALLRYYDILDK